MRLVQVRAVNYQSIGEVKINLGKYTVLIGKSDNGKTAILRAIAAALTNPTGRGNIRRGEKAIYVDLSYDNETTIKYRKAEYATYTIIKSGEPIEYERIRAVPGEVESIANPWEVAGWKSLIQIQMQEDPAFVISAASAGSRTSIERILDGLDGLVYRNALMNCERTVKNLSQQLKTSQAELKEAETAAESLEGLLETAKSVRDGAVTAVDEEMSIVIGGVNQMAAKLRKASLQVGKALQVTVTNETKTLRKAMSTIEPIVRAQAINAERKELLEEKEQTEKQLSKTKEELFVAGTCPLVRKETCPIYEMQEKS